MRAQRISISLALLCALLAFGRSATVQKAVCHLQGTSNAPTADGTFSFTATGNDVLVEAAVTGLPVDPTQFAIHVHAAGDVSAADGTSTAGHFNPAGVDHACPDGQRHVGDMGNWDAASGVISQSKTLDLLSLSGTNSIIGRAVTIHAGVDDCTSQPTGDAGARLAVCVIGIENPGEDDTNNAAADDAVNESAAVAVLSGTSNCPSCSGTVYFAETGSGIEITAVVTGLPSNGPRGIHIHQFGDLSRADGTGAGGHYNPDGVLHDLPGVEPRHRGDLGTMTGTNSGAPTSVYYRRVNTWVDGIDSILGRAVIVHTDFDHGSGAGCDQAGSAGARLLQGVIGVANADTDAPSIPSGTTGLDATLSSVDCVVSMPVAPDVPSAPPASPLSPSSGAGLPALAVVAAVAFVVAMFF